MLQGKIKKIWWTTYKKPNQINQVRTSYGRLKFIKQTKYSMFHRSAWLCFKWRRQICEVNLAVCNDPMAQLLNKAGWRQKNPLLSVFHSRTPNKAFRYQHDKKTVCNVQPDSCHCKIWPLQKRINPGNEGLVSQENCSSRTDRTLWLGTVLSFEARHRQNKRGYSFEFW